MNDDEIPDAVQGRYKEAWVRGPRITRLEETRLGYFRLDAKTAWELGNNNVGVFVGACPPLEATVECLRKLEERGLSEHWIVVAATKGTAVLIAQQWSLAGEVERVALTTMKESKVHSNIVLATSESLRRIGEAERRDVAGILLIDMLCDVYRARGMYLGDFFVRNDRPQLVANFRNNVAHEGWLPPLLLLTRKPAKSVSTDAIARAYRLDGWWFVDGRSLRCGPVPTPSQTMADHKPLSDGLT